MRKTHVSRTVNIWLAVFTILIIGCGNTQDDFVATIPNADQSVTAPIVGKVFASADLGGATVELRALSGATLASTTTNGTGNFVFRGTVPQNFRLVVPLEDGLFLARDVRNFTVGDFFVINVPTTMVSLAVTGGQTPDLTEAETFVLSQLQLSNREELLTIEDGVSNRFSHFAFFVEAAQNGGASTFISTVVNGESGVGSPFQLSVEHTQADLSGLPPQIRALLDKVKADPKIDLALKRPFTRNLDRSFSARGQGLIEATEQAPIRAQSFGVESVSNLLQFIGTSAESSLVEDDSNLDKVFSWVGVALGWRSSDTDTLEAIQAQLIQVQAGISELDAKSDNANFQSQKDDLATNSISPLTEIISRELLAISTTTSSDLDNRPAGGSVIPQNTLNYLALLEGSSAFSDAQANLREIQSSMVGYNAVPIDPGPIAVPRSQGSNLILTGAKIALTDELGVTVGVGNNSEVQQWANFPVRSGFLLDKALETFELYAQYQLLGMVALGETGHATSNPSADIDNLITQTANAMASIMSQRSQIPHYPRSENFFIDLQNGLVWYTVVQDPMTSQDATTFANHFDDGVYNDGWRLPAHQEAKALQQRAIYATVADGSLQYGDAVTGLQNLGFDVNELNSDGEFWNTNWDYDRSRDEWVVDSSIPLIFRLTHESNNHTFLTDSDDRNLEYPILLVRSIGKPALQMDDPGALDEPDAVWPDSMTTGVSTRDLPYIGVLTGFSDIQAGINDIDFAGTYDSTLGGGQFRLGTDTVNARFSTRLIHGYNGTTDRTLPYIYFTTSNTAESRASSFPGDFGSVYFNNNNNSNNTVFLNAVVRDSNDLFPVPTQASVNIKSFAPQSITSPDESQISPRNLTLDLIGISPSANSPTQRFVLTSFYNDESKIVRDTTDRVTWIVEDADTGEAVPGVTFASSVPGELVFNVSEFPVNVDSLNLRIRTDGDSDLEDETLVLVDIR